MNPLSFIKYCLLALLLTGSATATAQKVSAGSKSTRGDHTKAMHLEYSGNVYDVFVVEYPAKNIQLFWKSDKGALFKNNGTLKMYLESAGKKLLMATNAGMYTTENAPKGLYIENGVELRPIDMRSGPATNFYMQPNGVFYTTAKGAHIAPSALFNKQKEKVLNATQSGPMLVINGNINAQFTRGSKNVNIRNGAGIGKDGKVYFVISCGTVNFYDFAAFFKEKLLCDQALFFDGAICKMYMPQLKRDDTDGDLGPIIAVTDK